MILLVQGMLAVTSALEIQRRRHDGNSFSRPATELEEQRKGKLKAPSQESNGPGQGSLPQLPFGAPDRKTIAPNLTEWSQFK